MFLFAASVPDRRLPAAVNNSRSIQDILSIYMSDVYSTPLKYVFRCFCVIVS